MKLKECGHIKHYLFHERLKVGLQVKSTRKTTFDKVNVRSRPDSVPESILTTPPPTDTHNRCTLTNVIS